MYNRYEVIIIGGGHAGCEAAIAATRMGAKTCLITNNLSDIGNLSCNPSIGGIAKGIIVKEVNTLNGLMGIAADKSGIHFKVLNRNKGPSVWGPRIQVDRILYKRFVRNFVLNFNKLEIFYGIVDDILIDDNKQVYGICFQGKKILSHSVIITSGTFCNGVIHIGKEKYYGGRLGEQSVLKLAKKIQKLGFNIKRLKTGTPPRIYRDSINFNKLKLQYGDSFPESFSNLYHNVIQKQIPCYHSYTSNYSHKIIANSICHSSIYSGNIFVSGPRYCPSIEDKIIRFRNKKKHQIFIEFDGIESQIIYPSGLSMSLPRYIQNKLIRSILGFEKAKIMQYGYTIEYDCVSPQDIKKTLETKTIKNLFLAGQINGSTGYEEASGQGVIAGINAVLKIDLKYFILPRTISYIGVMLNDLNNIDIQEPYRIMTSKSEYRILIRYDNVLTRLKKLYKNITKIKKNNNNFFQFDKIRYIEKIIKTKCVNFILTKNISKIFTTYINKFFFTKIIFCKTNIIKKIVNIANIYVYMNYVKRLSIEIHNLNKDVIKDIPNNVNYTKIIGLPQEIKLKLLSLNPKNLFDIKKVEGITPLYTTWIYTYITKKYIKKF